MAMNKNKVGSSRKWKTYKIGKKENSSRPMAKPRPLHSLGQRVNIRGNTRNGSCHSRRHFRGGNWWF